jgi:hypothetical protein
MGQDAGLISDIPPAGEVVTRIAAEAQEILRKKLPALVAGNEDEGARPRPDGAFIRCHATSCITRTSMSRCNSLKAASI